VIDQESSVVDDAYSISGDKVRPNSSGYRT
jgi:hypothetical protein